MHKVYIEREPDVIHGSRRPTILVHLGGHPDERWRQVFMDPTFHDGPRFGAEPVGDAVAIAAPPLDAASALDWLATRIEQVNAASDVREHRVIEHALERAVHDWWTTRQLTDGVRP